MRATPTRPTRYPALRSVPMRVGLLMCGHVAPAVAATEGDYHELFAGLFGPHGVELEVFDVDQGRLPASLGDCDGWVTSPSPSSVLGEDPWLPDALDLVCRLVEEERPFAGICFGHQLL